MDFLYNLLKISSVIATGVFGAIGLLTKYKDDEGKITKLGKIALIGILISSGFYLSIYTIEASKAKEAADKAKSEADSTAKSLQTILDNAQITVEQQRRNLHETNILKEGLEKALEQQRLNLDRSDYIAKAMENSLEVQKSVLAGNKTILSGVTNTVEKQSQILSQTNISIEEVQKSRDAQLAVNLSDRMLSPMYTFRLVLGKDTDVRQAKYYGGYADHSISLDKPTALLGIPGAAVKTISFEFPKSQWATKLPQLRYSLSVKPLVEWIELRQGTKVSSVGMYWAKANKAVIEIFGSRFCSAERIPLDKYTIPAGWMMFNNLDQSVASLTIHFSKTENPKAYITEIDSMIGDAFIESGNDIGRRFFISAFLKRESLRDSLDEDNNTISITWRGTGEFATGQFFKSL